MDIKKARRQWQMQKWHAKNRNIEFNISFDDWCSIWQQSGKWDQRGRKKGQYVMSRYGDQGPYDSDNICIQLHSENVIEAQAGKSVSLETRQKISHSRTGLKIKKPQ